MGRSLGQDATIWMDLVSPRERRRESLSHTVTADPCCALQSSLAIKGEGDSAWPVVQRLATLRVVVGLEGLEFKDQVGWREGNSKR